MKKVITLYSLLFVLVTSVVAEAQDYKTDFIKMNSSYNTENNIISDVAYKYFANPGDKKPSDSLNGKIVLYHKNYSGHIGNINVTRNDKYFVEVDNDLKMIFLGDTKHLTIPVITINALDSLIQQKQVSISFTALSSSEGIYQINESQGNAFRYDIYFDRKTFLFKEIDVYYHFMPGESRQSTLHPVLKVYYKNSQKTSPNLSVFSENNYIHIQNKTVVPVEAYRSYKVINNLNP